MRAHPFGSRQVAGVWSRHGVAFPFGRKSKTREIGTRPVRGDGAAAQFPPDASFAIAATECDHNMRFVNLAVRAASIFSHTILGACTTQPRSSLTKVTGRGSCARETLRSAPLACFCKAKTAFIHVVQIVRRKSQFWLLTGPTGNGCDDENRNGTCLRERHTPIQDDRPSRW